MVSEPAIQADSAAPGSNSSADGSSISVANVLIGGIAGIILGFVPFSPVLGGAITGYLEDSTPNQAVKAGAMAGAVMLVPFFFIALVILMFMLGVGDAAFAFGFISFFVLVIGGVYTVGLSALGGYLGNYLQDEL